MKKKGQVTLFVIISVLLVTAIIGFFIFKPSFFSDISSTANPEGYLDKCAEDSIQKTEKLLLENNFHIDQNFTNYLLYKSEKVPYQCTASEFYLPCTPQEPGLFSSIKNLIENRALRDVDSCFRRMKQDFQSRGYSVSEDILSLNVTLSEEFIKINFKKNFLATKGDSSVSLGEIEASRSSSLYNLIKTTQTIVNYESTICEFNEISWMKAVPNILISKFVTSDSTRVYILTDRISSKQTKFAIRTCVLPAGI